MRCLIASEKEKKPTCRDKCKEQRHTFVPFVVSADGMVAPEAVNTLQRIAQLLGEKW